MNNQPGTVAFLHYSAPPIIGGVEAVIQAHTQVFIEAGYSVTVIAGKGDVDSLYPGAQFTLLPDMDSQASQVICLSELLEQGHIPTEFESFTDSLIAQLQPLLASIDNVIVHNLFTKHFNLPLTAALYRILDMGGIQNCIAWCHDISWTSPRSRVKVHEGYPWDLLRTYRPEVTYVAVSKKQQKMLAGLFDCPEKKIHVVCNGVDPQTLLGLSNEGYALAGRLGLLDSDINLLMPVRVTEAKNIEYAMQVVAALKTRGIHPRLVLTGPPDPHEAHSMGYFQTLQDLRRKLDIEDEMRFVFEEGPNGEPYTISLLNVGELYRLSDVMLMPSHYEGFGMPVLEAGLHGIPVFTTEVPAAVEIGMQDVTLFDKNMDPLKLADRLWEWIEGHPTMRFRRRVRQQFPWEAILKRDIQPLLKPKT